MSIVLNNQQNDIIFAPAYAKEFVFTSVGLKAHRNFFDLVAQLVEHLPFKERVPGSSPGQVTLNIFNYSKTLLIKILAGFCVFATFHLPNKIQNTPQTENI